MTVSVENFVDVLTFAYQIQWDPTILCLNTDTLNFDNPQIDAGFPNGLSTAADLNAELEMIANSGKLSMVFFDDVTFEGVTLPDGTPMIRFLFEACGELDCSSFTMCTDFANTSVTQSNIPLGIMCTRESVDFITEPVVDEACVICGAQPQIIDRNICKNSDGSLSLSFSACGDAAPFTWTVVGEDSGVIDMAGDVVSIVLPPSTSDYSLIVTDANGVDAPGNTGFGLEFINPDDFSPLEATLSFTPDPLECATDRASITYAITGGNTLNPVSGIDEELYDLSLSNGLTQLNAPRNGIFQNLEPGQYFLTASDNFGCETTEAITIAAPPPITFDIEVDSSTCVGADDWEVRIIPSGGTPLYGLLNEPLTDTIVVPGFTLFGDDTFSDQFFDANGCVTNFSVFIPVGDSFDFTENLIPTDCNSNIGYTSRIDLPSSASDYLGMLRNDDTNTEIGVGSSANFLQAINLVPGNYTWFIEDRVTGCTVEFSLVVPNDIPPAVVLTDSSIQPSCGSDNGIATVDVSGGTGSFVFAWEDFPMETTNSISPLAAGTYTVTVTDADTGCGEVIDLDLMGGDFLSLEAMVRDSLVCTDPNANAELRATITASTNDITITWRDDTGAVVGSNATLNTTIPGTYTVEVEINGSNCSAMETVVLEPVASFSFDLVTVNPQICPTAEAGEVFIENLLGGSGNFTITWSVVLIDGDGSDLGLPPGMEVTVQSVLLRPGNAFTVTIVDEDTGCRLIRSTTLVADGEIEFTDLITPPSCIGANDGMIQIMGMSGSPLICTDEDGEDIQGCVFTGVAGEHTITILDGVCPEIVTFIIPPPEIFSASIIMTDDPDCNGGNGGSATVQIDGNPSNFTDFSFSWNGGPTELNGLMDTETGLSAGENFVVVGDDNACVDTIEFILFEPGPVFNVPLDDLSVTCRGMCDATVELNPEGGTTANGIYNYLWSDGATFRTRNDLCAGNVSVTITDDNNCTFIDSFVVMEPDSIIIDTLIRNLSCMDASTGGDITINPAGGCEGFTFDWPADLSIDITDNMVTGLALGDYSITVTDACGCENIVDAAITGVEPITATPLDVTQINCAGELAAIGIQPNSVSGGSGTGFTYAINFGNRLPVDSVVMVAPGQYTLAVFDSEGCSSGDLDIFVDTCLLYTSPSPRDRG